MEIFQMNNHKRHNIISAIKFTLHVTIIALSIPAILSCDERDGLIIDVKLWNKTSDTILVAFSEDKDIASFDNGEKAITPRNIYEMVPNQLSYVWGMWCEAKRLKLYATRKKSLAGLSSTDSIKVDFFDYSQEFSSKELKEKDYLIEITK